MGMIRQCSRCCKLEYKNKEAASSGNLKHDKFDQSRCVSAEFN